jgi:hypothetical protein
MASYNSRPNNEASTDILSKLLQPGIAFVVIIFGALIAFEIFNYSTTDHALRDLLGDLQFAGISWATILAIAFCGIDFAGIARLFTPEQGSEEPKEVWYLFGAWLLAATMNAILTWWGVSIAVVNHNMQSSTVLDPTTINSVVPVFVAIMVWVIRILIIGTLSLAMDRLMHPGMEQRTAFQKAMSASRDNQHQRMPVPPQTVNIPTAFNSSGMQHRNTPANPRSVAAQPRTMRNAEPPVEIDFENLSNGRNARPDPTYHTLTASGRRPGNSDNNSGGSNNSPVNGQRRF